MKSTYKFISRTAQIKCDRIILSANGLCQITPRNKSEKSVVKVPRREGTAMNFHSKNGVLFIVQIDHLTGEQIGYVIERFYDAGASNVQVMSSVTKKNRPAHVIFIDCRAERSENVEALIPEELGAGGWHKVTTEHHFLYNKILERKVIVRHGDETGPEWTVMGKWFENGNLRPEHDSVISLQEAIHGQFGIFAGYFRLYHLIMNALETEGEDPFLIRL